MQLDINDAILAVGAIAVVAALLMGGARLFGKKSPSTAATTLLVLLGVSGAALLIWVVTRAHLIAEVSPDAATQATTPEHSASPTATAAQPAQPDPLLTATSEFLACAVPVEPDAVPDGATASFEQMRAARASVFAFDAATAAYNKCVDSTVNDGVQQYAGVSAATSSVSIQVLKALGTRLHNAAVEKDQAVANRMNQQIRIFKARHS
jgi:hypothetical protein